MKLFEGVRVSAYFQGGRLKQDKKTCVRYWSMTFALTMRAADVHKCAELIVSNYQQISADENCCDELSIAHPAVAYSISFLDLEDSTKPSLSLAKCDVSGLRLTRSDGLVELWMTVEHDNGDALHRFVKDYAFTRVWMEFLPRQASLSVGDAPVSAALANAIDRLAQPVRDGSITSLTIEGAGQIVTIDKAAAERIGDKVRAQGEV